MLSNGSYYYFYYYDDDDDYYYYRGFIKSLNTMARDSFPSWFPRLPPSLPIPTADEKGIHIN